jgi:hypothetical protein
MRAEAVPVAGDHPLLLSSGVENLILIDAAVALQRDLSGFVASFGPHRGQCGTKQGDSRTKL